MRYHDVGNGCGVNFTFNVGPKVEIDTIEIRRTRGPLYWPVTPNPLPREMVIQVLTCYEAEMQQWVSWKLFTFGPMLIGTFCLIRGGE